MTGLKVFHQLTLAGARRIPALAQAAQVVHGQRQADVGKLPGKLLVGAGLLRLALERAELTAHLSRHIAHTGECGVHGGQLAFAFRLALLVLEHASGLLDERAAVLRLGLQDGVQAALADDRMRAGAQTGIVQDVEHVHAARNAAVDEILAFAASIHAARDGNLVEVDRQLAVGVVEHQLNLG